MRFSLFMLLLLLALVAKAQFTITGKVVSKVNNQPVADASVYLNNSSVGTKTGIDGAFTLYNVKNGQYDLVVSCVGYETAHQAVFANVNIRLPAIELMPKVTELREVKIKYDANRDRYLRMFIREFIGRHKNAENSRILNPDVLYFDYDKQKMELKANTGDDFLLIENKALGYSIKYQLIEFSCESFRGAVFYYGSTIFTPMKGKPSDQRRWERRRKEAYYGSAMHFLRSAIAVRVAEEDFLVRRLIRGNNPDRAPDSVINKQLRRWQMSISPITPMPDSLIYWNKENRKPKTIATLVTTPLQVDQYIKLTERKDVFAFGFKDCLQITYKKREDNTSVVTFTKPYAFFDMNGIVLNPHSYLMEGFWGTQRIAEMLPVDYVVPLDK